MSCFAVCFVLFPRQAFPEEPSLIAVTPAVRAYAEETVRPALGSLEKRDRLSLLMTVSKVLIDPAKGVHVNAMKPRDFILYNKLDKLKLGFLISFKLSAEQKTILRAWNARFMQENPANVFFAPSADDIVRTRAAFGCSHYARAFMAVVKALGIVDAPEDLRYAVSSKADSYNEALEAGDADRTIHGHQFVLARVENSWMAINTSKGEWTAMPRGFSPEAVRPPLNIPVRFESYPDIAFLLRKVGRDRHDDCGDRSLRALMNISRSGDAGIPEFRWNPYKAPGKG